MPTEEIEYIEPTQEHVGQMVEVRDNEQHTWKAARLTGILSDDARFAAKRQFDGYSIGWQFARIARPLTYAERQEKCGLKVGDRVRVMRSWDKGEQYFGYDYQNHLGAYLATIQTIEVIERGRIKLKECSAAWPYFVLEKVETQYREIQCDIGAKVVRINLNNKPTEYTLHNIFVDSDGCKFGVVKDLSNNWDVIELCDLRIEA